MRPVPTTRLLLPIFLFVPGGLLAPDRGSSLAIDDLEILRVDRWEADGPGMVVRVLRTRRSPAELAGWADRVP